MMRLLLVAALVGCSDPGPRLPLVVDLPPEGSAGFPFVEGQLDSLQLIVSLAASDTIVDSTTRAPGEVLSIEDIPFGRDLVLELSGTLGGNQIAYGRSCPFDFDRELGGPDEIHLYFARVRTWADGPAALVPDRIGGHAYVRASGEVYIAGGRDGGPLESFDPRLGVFAPVDDAPLTLARSGGTLAAVGDDAAIIVGGTAGASGPPVTEIETLPDLRNNLDGGPPLRRHAATDLAGGGALVVGGELLDGGDYIAVADAREFEADGTTIRPGNPIPDMAFARAGHTATRVSDEFGAAVLIAGGIDDSGAAVTATEIYRPLSGTFQLLPGLLDRHGHQAIRFDGGFVLIIGGFTSAGLPATELLLFDLVQGDFSPAGQLPAAAAITGFAATPLADGRVMLTGGRDVNGDVVAAAHLASLDPVDGQVTISQTNFLSAPRASHIGVELCDRSLLLIGGESTDGAALPTERYVPGLER